MATFGQIVETVIFAYYERGSRIQLVFLMWFHPSVVSSRFIKSTHLSDSSRLQMLKEIQIAGLM